MTLVKVEQRHIDAGRDNVTGSCPIDFAIAELKGISVERVGTGFSTVVIYDDSGNRDGPIYELPTRAQSFVNRYDSEEPVKPFAFRLPL